MLGARAVRGPRGSERARMRRIEVHDRRRARRRRDRGRPDRRCRDALRRRRGRRRPTPRRGIGGAVPERSACRGHLVRTRRARVRIRLEPGIDLRHGRHLPDGAMEPRGARVRRRLSGDAIVSVPRHLRGRLARRALRPARPHLRLPHRPLRLLRRLRPGAAGRIGRSEVALPGARHGLSETPTPAWQRVHERRDLVRLRIVHRPRWLR